MKRFGISMVLLLALLLLSANLASAKTHWSFYAGVTPSYTYVQPYPYTYYYGTPYYYYPRPYTSYYYMYPRHEWGYYWHSRGWHGRHWR